MVLEIYLFVDPMKKHSLSAEESIEKISKKLNINCSVNFIPMLNLRALNDCKKRLKISSSIPYDVVLDYKAASFQGKKIGREFLMNLQNRLFNAKQNYCDQLVLQVAKQIGLDLDMFVDDRRSDLAMKIFQSDQRIIHRMKVTQPESAVIFNSAVEKSGLLIRNFDYPSLLHFCQRSLKSVNHFENLTQQNKAACNVSKISVLF